MTNTTSTNYNAMPSVGSDKAPPELISSVDGAFVPQDSHPENTERMTGGTQKQPVQDGQGVGHKEGVEAGQGVGEGGEELNVGEIEGGTFRVEPLRRTGEDDSTMRARLLCSFILTPYSAL